MILTTLNDRLVVSGGECIEYSNGSKRLSDSSCVKISDFVKTLRERNQKMLEEENKVLGKIIDNHK